MFGECCFDVGDIKCTMGTGMFIDLNTGHKPHASVAGKNVCKNVSCLPGADSFKHTAVTLIY